MQVLNLLRILFLLSCPTQTKSNCLALNPLSRQAMALHLVHALWLEQLPCPHQIKQPSLQEPLQSWCWQKCSSWVIQYQLCCRQECGVGSKRDCPLCFCIHQSVHEQLPWVFLIVKKNNPYILLEVNVT